MERSVIVYGPQGCGKTRYAEAFRRYFELVAVVDEVYLSTSLSPLGVLYLTNSNPRTLCRTGIRQIAFADVVAQAEAAGFSIATCGTLPPIAETALYHKGYGK